jgi:hypothetical protein
MWGPMLKYRLDVRGRTLDNVVVSAPGSFHCGSPRGFSVVPSSWLAWLPRSPLRGVGGGGEGVTWRGHATPCIVLWIIADRRFNNVCWQASPRHTIEANVTLDRLFEGGGQTLWEGWSVLALTIRVLYGPDLLWRIPSSSAKLIWCQGNRDVCVSSWWSLYVRRRCDGYQFSSAYC